MSNSANGQIANVLNETRVFPPSEAFAKQALVGSLAAYEDLYRLLSRRVYAFVRQMIGDAESADEIMVDTM